MNRAWEKQMRVLSCTCGSITYGMLDCVIGCVAATECPTVMSERAESRVRDGGEDAKLVRCRCE